MSTIIEHIGSEGVKVTPDSLISTRIDRPSPFHSDSFLNDGKLKPFVARIDSVKDGKVHICMHSSVYWGSKDNVSISGGPFHSLPIETLKYERMELVKFWNFANGSGSGMGCEYWVNRPAYTFNYEDWKK
jgi:hypothetical protein